MKLIFLAAVLLAGTYVRVCVLSYEKSCPFVGTWSSLHNIMSVVFVIFVIHIMYYQWPTFRRIECELVTSFLLY